MSDPEPPSRPLKGRIVFSVCFGLLLVLVLEAGLRLTGFVHVQGAEIPNEARRHELTDGRLYEPDAELLWRLLPSRTLDVGDPAYPRFRTNSLGLRGAELAPREDPAELRVVCLGDSITFGVGLAEGATWPDVLASELRADPPDRWTGVRVVNAGVAGYSAVQGERLLARVAALDPDVVVFWFGMNDAKPAYGVPDTELRVDPDAEPSGAVAGWSAHIRILQFAQWLARPRDGGEPRVSAAEFGAIVQRLIGPARPRVLFVRTPEQMTTTLEQLDGLLTRARAVGADRVAAPGVVLIPYAPAPPRVLAYELVVTTEEAKTLRIGPPDADTYEIEVEELARRVRDLRAWKQGLDALLDLLPEDALRHEDLLGTAPAAESFSDNCHLTTAGAQRVGAALAAVIRREVPSPDAARTRDR